MKPIIHPDAVIGHRKPPGFQWGRECDPTASPLKENALRTLRPEFSSFGFGTGPVQRRKTFLRIPIHWIYKANRDNNPYCYYKPVAAVSVPCDDLGEEWKFAYTSTCEWLENFGQFFDLFLELWQPDELFSDEGLAEIRRFSRSVQTGKRCVGSDKLIRHEFVTRHPELWDSPLELLAQLRKYKLYKETTPVSQALEHLQLVIDRARRGERPEDFVQKPQGRSPYENDAS